MSVDNVRAFFAKVQTDPELRARLKNSGARNKEEATQALLRIASEAGFVFTAEHYEASTRSHQGPAGAAHQDPSGAGNTGRS